MNKSGLKPLGRAVLVTPYEPERKQSVIHIPETINERTKMVETRAIVVDIGPSAWYDEPTPRASVGDKVMVSKFAGVVVKGTADGMMYRLVNDMDLFCRIEVDSHE